MPTNVGGVAVKVRLDDKDALNELNKLKGKIAKLNSELSKKRAERDSIAKEMEKAEISAERARQKVKELQKALASASPSERAGVRAQLTAANADLREQTRNLDQMNRQWQKLDGEITTGAQSLEGMEAQQANLTQQVKASTGAVAKMRSAAVSAARSMQRAFSRLGTMIRRVFVFQLIFSALRQLREYVSDLLMSVPEFREALSDLKSNLLTAAQPLLNVLIPALTTFVQILSQAAAILADIVAKIFRTTAAKSQEGAKALYEQADAYKKAGSAAQKASKQLASFDQLNVLSSNSSGGSGSEGGEGTAPSFGTDFDGLLKDKLGALELLVGEALLVLGAILTFTGVNIPLGIALLALGAANIAAAASLDWETLKTQMQGPIGDIFAIVAAAALVLGAILTFTGINLPLGIALMVIGAAGLASAVALKWDAIKAALQGPMGAVVALVSGALLLMGIVFLMSGAAIPLGIALLVAGAAGLATTVALNWDAIKTALQGPIGKVTAIASAALLALGAILVFSGVALPLGIALMAAGAAGLVTVAVLNWNAIKAALQGPVGAIVALASGALLALGIILVASGVGLPLGIALIAAGAAGLVTVTALNWNSIKEKVVGVWESIKSWWKTSVAPVFTIEWWKEKFASIGEGLKEKIKDGVNGAIGLLNSFINWINDKLNISWDGLSLFGAEIIKAGNWQLLTIPNVPYLAQGAVIPPNREFMAVLGDQKSGTNIETPLATMVQAFRQAMAEGAGGDLYITLTMDGEKVMQKVVKNYNRYARASGRLSTL